MQVRILILWLISPLVTLYYSLKNIRDPRAFNGLLLFSFFFGMTFFVPENIEGSADAARYGEELRELHDQSLELKDVLSYIYSKETNKVDIYQPLITWGVSNFTSNPKWLFAIFALVFGWFWFKNIQLLILNIKSEVNWMLFLLILVFALVNPIWEINGVRMWTAAQIYVYGVLGFFINGNRKSIFFSFSAIFVHFSFVLPFLLLVLYRFFPKGINIFFITYLISFFIKELNIEVIQQYYTLLPDFLQSRKTYISDDYVEDFQVLKQTGEGYSWHVVFVHSIQKSLVIVSSVFIFFSLKIRNISAKDYLYRLLSFFFLFSTVANLASNLPSGGRFLVIGNMFALAILFLYYSQKHIHFKKIDSLLRLSVPFLFFLVLFKIRISFEYITLVTILGNPVFAIFTSGFPPLISFVKELFG